ncbi:hypothetical protein [Nonomuraea sp. NPDC052265]|uniref:hypothetical protein n=1 Tax=Nonomuraea sp. NPDC052265 TaxID=3364374 RepID=UPI0037C868D0
MDDDVDRLTTRIAELLADEPEVKMSDEQVEAAALIIGADGASGMVYRAVA